MYTNRGLTSHWTFLFSTPLNQDQNGINHDFEIERKAHIFDVKDVEFKALDHLWQVRGIAIFNLAPGGNAGSHLQQMFVVGRFLHDQINVVLSFGPWTYQ